MRQCLVIGQWSLGAAQAALALVCVLILFIISCAMAPSIRVDAKGVLGLTLEWGLNFNETVAAINVYQLICSVLLRSLFIRATRADSCGLVTLVVLSTATSTSMAMPLLQLVRAMQR
jgi:hypothetical protein